MQSDVTAALAAFWLLAILAAAAWFVAIDGGYTPFGLAPPEFVLRHAGQTNCSFRGLPGGTPEYGECVVRFVAAHNQH